MNEPIRTPEHRTIWEERPLPDKEWTYEEILNLFPDGDGSLVNPLVRRCQQHEQEIERLRAADAYHRETIGKCNAHIQEQEVEIERLRAELAAFNTAWQHDPPQVGDTKWVRMRWHQPSGPMDWPEEPVE